MELKYEISYLPCQSCGEKTHCDRCAERICASLLRLDGVETAEVSIPGKTMRITGSGIDEDALEDALDELGVFI